MTTISIVGNIITGSGIYTFFAYKAYYKKWFMFIIGIFSCLLVLYIVFNMKRKFLGQKLSQINDREKRIFIIKSRVLRSMNSAGLMGMIMVIIMTIPIGYNRVVYHGIAAANYNYSSDDYPSDITRNEYIKENIDMFKLIRDNNHWKPLSLDKKLEVLQTICDGEKLLCGLNDHITVAMDDLSEDILGEYIDSQKIILIDKRHIEQDSAEEVFATTIHEMFHAWEYSLVRLYLKTEPSLRTLRIFDHCDEYVEEIIDYRDGEGDDESYMSYYCQYMEEDCREYVDMVVPTYYDMINIMTSK